MNKRLTTLEQKAERYFTTSEILDFLRQMFAIADRTISSADDLCKFKDAVIDGCGEMLGIAAKKLREVLL